MKIPLAKPWFDEEDEAAVLATLRSGWIGQGPRVAGFEADFARYTGASHATAVASCTAALHMAATALGWGPGDEVLVPAFTWISTPNAIELAGARAVFTDIDPRTFNIDVEDAARRVTGRTRGILPVHLFGLAADMDAVLSLAHRSGLKVLEDAACALGAYVGDRHVGTLGEIGCFSFHPRKSITTGEGGMLTTADAGLDELFRSLRDIGSDRANMDPAKAAQQLMPDFPRLSTNYRLTDLQAALGSTQLSKFDRIMAQRLEAAARYRELISGSDLSEWLAAPAMPQGREHSFQAYVCRLLPPDDGEATLATWHERRNRLMEALFREGVGTRPGTHAPHMLAYYRDKYDLRPRDFPNAWRADWLTLALPFHVALTAGDQEWLCQRLDAIWRGLQ